MIEKKVQAGTLSAAVAGVVLWVCQQYVFKGNMPQGFESLVYLAVPAVLAGAAGWLAPHTHRADLSPASAPPPGGGQMAVAGAFLPSFPEPPPAPPPAPGTKP